MERSIQLPAAADEKADQPLVEKPPAESPISTAWEVFERLALPRKMHGEQRRYLKHAFYAGARAAFTGVMDALREIEAADPNGDKRLEMVEREVDAYFTEIIGQALISRTGKA